MQRKKILVVEGNREMRSIPVYRLLRRGEFDIVVRDKVERVLGETSLPGETDRVGEMPGSEMTSAACASKPGVSRDRFSAAYGLGLSVIVLFLVLVAGSLSPTAAGEVPGSTSLSSGVEGKFTRMAGGLGGIHLVAVPLEDRLSAGTTGFLRTISKKFRQLRRVIGNAALRWRSWLGGALIFLGFAVVAPVLDRSVVEVWQRDGLRAFLRSLFAGAAVYVRLLRDSRTPFVGKALLAFAVVYGVSGRDLMPDAAGIVNGLLDDFVLLILASRGFMRMCPDEIVEEQAIRVAAAGERAA